MQISKAKIKEACDKAYKEAGVNAYFGNGFKAGVEFALNNCVMAKEHVKIEFRYHDTFKDDTTYINKVITVGIYDTLEEAVNEGNKALRQLSKTFKFREEFKITGLWGLPTRLVTNLGDSHPVGVFASIVSLDYSEMSDAVNEVLAATERYKNFKLRNED